MSLRDTANVHYYIGFLNSGDSTCYIYFFGSILPYSKAFQGLFIVPYTTNRAFLSLSSPPPCCITSTVSLTIRFAVGTAVKNRIFMKMDRFNILGLLSEI